MPQIQGNLKDTAWICTQALMLWHFWHGIKLYVIESCLPGSVCQTDPDCILCIKPNTSLAQQQRTQICKTWNKHPQVLLEVRALCLSEVSPPHSQVTDQHRAACVCLQGICPLLLPLNCAFHPFCWQGSAKDDLGHQEGFRKEHPHLPQ